MTMLYKNRFSQLTFIIFAGLFLMFGATTGLAQVGGNKEVIRLQVRINGIPGDGVGGIIEAFGSDQLVTSTASNSNGSGGGAGKAEFGPLVITKMIDRATPKLFLACATGMHITQAQIDWVRSNSKNGNDEVFFTVLLQDVTIAAVRSSLPNQNDPNLKQLGPVEQISLSFAKIQWTFFLPDGTPIKGGFDVNANQTF